MTRSLIVVILAAGLSLGVAGGVMAGWQWQQLPAAMRVKSSPMPGSGHPIYALDPRDDRA